MSATTLSLSACGGDDDDDEGTSGGADAAVLAGICPDSNHPHAMDMGEAGFWACCNVGADKPEEFGGYFAWGETEPKSDYSWASYDYWTDGNDDGYVQDGELTDLGFDIGGSSTYDAATKNWGSSWRMPSYNQMEKLKSNGSSEWTQLNGINGRMFTAPNGNKIFLPASGYRHEALSYEDGIEGCYWSSSVFSSGSTTGAYRMFCYSGNVLQDVQARFRGQTIRPMRQ